MIWAATGDKEISSGKKRTEWVSLAISKKK